MAQKPLEVYLNDHLGGAMLGCDLAPSSRDQNEGTPLGEAMTPIAAEIEEDRETLLALMDALGVSRNPVKQVTGWVAEKASRVKFSGATSGEPEHGTFMALESLRLGVAGKRCLWIALREVRDDYPELGDSTSTGWSSAPPSQESELERERARGRGRGPAAAAEPSARPRSRAAPRR